MNTDTISPVMLEVASAEVAVAHTMQIIGGERGVWGADEESISAARQTFESYLRMGYTAYSFKTAGGSGEVAHEFDPTAEKIILAGPMAGG